MPHLRLPRRPGMQVKRWRHMAVQAQQQWMLVPYLGVHLDHQLVLALLAGVAANQSTALWNSRLEEVPICLIVCALALC